jgi:hypothetical protein
MARAALAALVLLFAARQAVALTLCCCESLCRKPNEPCDRHDHAPRPAQDDC